jgi:tetratricopeptide (TPR) repeat protein
MPESKRDLVFLCYAHEDLKKVEKVYEGLEKRGLKVWLDRTDIKKGKWKPQIMKALSRSRIFIFCLSNAALERTSGTKPGFQDTELQYAYEIAMNQPDDQFTILPVRLEDCGRGDHRISIFQQYDLFEDWENGLDKLAVDLGGVSLSDSKVKDERTEIEKMVAGMINKCETFYFKGEYEKSLTFIEAAIQIEPENHEVWNIKGIISVALNKYEEAIDLFNTGIEIKPDSQELWYHKGNTLFRLGRHKEAIMAYDKAIEINPDFHEAWYNKGNTLVNLGRHEEAIKAYDIAIEVEQDDYAAWSNKGNALYKLGRYEEAIKAYDNVLFIKPDFDSAWHKKITLEKIKKSTLVLRLGIDGRWTVYEMSKMFSILGDLYNFTLATAIIKNQFESIKSSHEDEEKKTLEFIKLHDIYFPLLKSTNFTEHFRTSTEGEELTIKSIHYGSPGTQDITGIGQAIKHILDFVIKIIEHYSSKKERALKNYAKELAIEEKKLTIEKKKKEIKLGNEKKELENEAFKLKNAELYLKLVKNCGIFSESELQRMLPSILKKQDFFIKLVEERKIVSVTIPSNEKK